MNPDAIAIVGIAGRFPGARNVTELWANLVNGVESIRRCERTVEGRVPAVATMAGVDMFDAAFFGISPAFAEIMDPQHRVFMEVAWEALEDAGYDPATYDGVAGVYAGATANTYYALNLAPNPATMARFSPVDVNTANANDFLTTRFSYFAGLTGPSHAVQCACSTSLVAVCLACQAIADGLCDMALAGGVSVNVMHLDGYRHVEGGMFSPDGHCRPFSAAAAGTVFGNGAGVVVLKPIAHAIRDGDHVYAAIVGSAVNNDGRRKVGYLAPGVDGQARVVAEALGHAGAAAESIGFVEAHGTGTPLGDPIEVRALTHAFRESTRRNGFCRLGSVKSNLGHLDAAAGVTGLIKAALVVAHGVVPPTLHAEEPNPAFELADTPFVVNTQCEEWPESTGRRAGVSAFGVGGTNAHVVLEQAPAVAPSTVAARSELLPLSARSAAALRTASANLAGWLRDHPSANLADVAYTLTLGRHRFAVRRAIVCRTVDEAVAWLADESATELASPTDDTRLVGLVLSDRRLAGKDCVRLFGALAGREPWLADVLADCADDARLQSFAAQCAVAASLSGLGLRADAVFAVGDLSIAEQVVDGTLPLREALRHVGEAVGSRAPAPTARDCARAWAIQYDGILVHFGEGHALDAASIDGAAAFTAAEPFGGVLRIVGAAWERGAAVDWRAAYASDRRQRLSLPTYPFEHRRYWIDNAAIARPASSSPRAEPAPRPDLATPFAAPFSPLHEAIQDVWGRALGIAGIGIDDSFFELGGDSLLAVRVATDLTQSLGQTVSAPVVYEAMTIRRLADGLASPSAPTRDTTVLAETVRLRRARHDRARRSPTRTLDATAADR